MSDKISCYVCHVGAYPMQQYCGSCGYELLSELIPETKPVYTQAMKDNGVMPLAGMECMVLNDDLVNYEYEKCTVDFIGCHIAVYSSESCTERTCNLEFIKFKPIDTRTDTEKAIDDLNCHSNGDGLTRKASVIAFELIKAGKIHGVTFTGEE